MKEKEQKEETNEQKKGRQAIEFKDSPTFLKSYTEWIQNSASNWKAGHIRHDLKEIPLSDKIETILILGSGKSLEDNLPLIKAISSDPTTLTVAGVTNLTFLTVNDIIPDISVILDASETMAKYFTQALTLPDFQKKYRSLKYITASHIHPTLAALLPNKNTYWYKPFITHLDGNGQKLFNSILNALTPPIDTFVMQAGCVTNGSLLMSNYFFKTEKIPSLKALITAGADYCFYPEQNHFKIPMYEYSKKERAPVAVLYNPPAVLKEQLKNFEGYWTTDRELSYCYDLFNIVKRLPLEEKTYSRNYLITILPDSLASFFCPLTASDLKYLLRWRDHLSCLNLSRIKDCCALLPGTNSAVLNDETTKEETK